MRLPYIRLDYHLVHTLILTNIGLEVFLAIICCELEYPAIKIKMVPAPRFERGTYRLQGDCTTVMLCRQNVEPRSLLVPFQ